jgi:hypothetical protein
MLSMPPRRAPMNVVEYNSRRSLDFRGPMDTHQTLLLPSRQGGPPIKIQR